MPRWTIIALLGLGVALVVASLALRAASAGRYEVKTTDLVFLIVPLLLVSLATGKLKGLDLFGVKADFSALWTEAASTKIQDQVSTAQPATVQDAVEVVEMAQKGGVGMIQRLVAQKVQALEFRLGQGSYYGPAIKNYFDALSGSSQLRLVVINSPSGDLFGVYIAPDLISSLRVTGDEGYRQFEGWLNSGNQAELARLPGFVAGSSAVTPATSKRDALARMEQLNVDTLPVVDTQGRFAGIVGRSKLTAALLLAITEKLESSN